jgi:hypothetical protein
MAAETKGREPWTEEEFSGRNTDPSNPLMLSRVFRFNDPQTGAPQIYLI